jgi:WXXGXW repeat (2 copies)
MERVTKWLCFVALITGILVVPPPSQAQISVGVAIHVGPPALPVYSQPFCPGAGYIWTPGYWAYGPVGYFWVPGTWVLAPSPGMLWTPGYWGWGGGGYLWHAGYWGPHVGFYGGINYGYGYTGSGFYGGEWRGGVYHYNTAVTNVNTTIVHNTYRTTVVNNYTTVNRVSYNGGTGGVMARPTGMEMAAERDRHIQATSLQAEHEHAASSNRALWASENHGSPSVAATARPGAFSGPGVVAAHHSNATYNENRGGAEGGRNNEMHTDRPPNGRPTGNVSPGGSNMNHPNTSQGHATQAYTEHPNTTQPNGPHPNEVHPNNEHQNNEHPNSAHPHTESAPKQTHPSEPHRGGREQ